MLRLSTVFISIILVNILALGGFNVWQAKAVEHTQIDLKDVLKDKAACRSLVIDYAYHRDQGHAGELAKLFTQDAQLIVMGNKIEGREAIEQRVADAKSGPLLRHMMSTIRIVLIDKDHASGVSYVTVYSSPAGTLPLPLTEFSALGEYHDEFVRTVEGWKIQSRQFIPVFVPPS
ncbi:MAG: hypothetical protein ACI8Z1_002621 [Candidatus Azotimanducaceae bacterium]